jgi:hypothetical protein
MWCLLLAPLLRRTLACQHICINHELRAYDGYVSSCPERKTGWFSSRLVGGRRGFGAEISGKDLSEEMNVNRL